MVVAHLKLTSSHHHLTSVNLQLNRLVERRHSPRPLRRPPSLPPPSLRLLLLTRELEPTANVARRRRRVSFAPPPPLPPLSRPAMCSGHRSAAQLTTKPRSRRLDRRPLTPSHSPVVLTIIDYSNSALSLPPPPSPSPKPIDELKVRSRQQPRAIAFLSV